MALKISCPHCSRRHELTAPYPLPGSEVHCWCGRGLSISYPAGLVERLRARGLKFQGDDDEQPADDSEIEVIEKTPTAPTPKPHPDALSNLPSLDAWERLPTQETQKSGGDDHYDTVIMKGRQSAIELVRLGAIGTGEIGQDSPDGPAITTSAMGTDAPGNRGGEGVESAPSETTADMGNKAPQNRDTPSPQPERVMSARQSPVENTAPTP